MKNIVILIVSLILFACSTTSQDARLAIYPSVEASNVGSGITVSVTVDDARNTGIIGTIGEGAQITTSQDLSQTIGLALVDALSKQGFKVSAASNLQAINLSVSLEELTYSRDGNAVSTDVETTSKVKVDISDKGFIRTYSNAEQRTIPFSANEDSNNSQLSSTLGAIIDKIVNDQELIAALRQ
mgnify:FL=1